MKTKAIFSSLLLAATTLALLSNCSGKKTQSPEGDHAHEQASGSEAPAEAQEPRFQVDQQFQEQLSAVFTSYVELKEAFVSSDAEEVQQEASKADEALAKVDMKLLTGAAHNDWMNYLSPMQMSVSAIQSSEDIEVQRKAFSTLSDNLYKSIKAFGLGGKEAFYGYCPMAFNNEGAYWLSDEEKIRNPYFGDKMLACGEVKEKLN